LGEHSHAHTAFCTCGHGYALYSTAVFDVLAVSAAFFLESYW